MLGIVDINKCFLKPCLFVDINKGFIVVHDINDSHSALMDDTQHVIGNDLNILLLRLEQLQFDEFTTAGNFGNVARAVSRVYHTRVRMSADYVADRCGELLAVCGESLEPPPTVPPTPVPTGGESQRRQMQRLRQALLCQEPAKVRLVAWVDREIRLWHVLRNLTGLTDVARQVAQLKMMKNNPLETENQRDIAQKLLAFMDAMHKYKARYSETGEFNREFLSWEQLQMAALVRKLDRDWMQFE